MALLKAVRSQQGRFKADNYEDGAAYFALAGEAAAAEAVAVEPASLSDLCEKLKACETRQRDWPKGSDDVTHLKPLEALKCRHSI